MRYETFTPFNSALVKGGGREIPPNGIGVDDPMMFQVVTATHIPCFATSRFPSRKLRAATSPAR